MPPDRNMPYGTSAALMQIDTFLQRAIEPRQRLVFVDVLRTAFGNVRDTAAIEDVPVGAGDRFARQQTLDALEDRFRAGGELQLQQLLARGRTDGARRQAGLQQRLRLGGEGQAVAGLRDVERLDAEWVAGQRHRALDAFVDRDRVHAAQVLRVVGAFA